jgi:hypothetical protein
MPAYAVPGDLFKQVFCATHDMPKYFYLDEGRSCVECGNDFVLRPTSNVSGMRH